ncbi:hypothetical protein G4B88_013715, partial [Cannabis sativa]
LPLFHLDILLEVELHKVEDFPCMKLHHGIGVECFLEFLLTNCYLTSPIHPDDPLELFFDKFKAINPTSLDMSLGISPISLLLDKSMLFNSPTFLNSEIVPFHINTNFSRLKSSGTPCCPRLLERVLRIRRPVRLVPIHVGISPDNLFPPTSNITNWVQFFNDEGNSAVKLLFLKCNTLMETKKPMEIGIFPDNLLFAKTRIRRERACDQQSGISPDNWLYETSRKIKGINSMASHMEFSCENLLLKRFSEAVTWSKKLGTEPSN